jgi:hypothetical protein
VPAHLNASVGATATLLARDPSPRPNCRSVAGAWEACLVDPTTVTIRLLRADAIVLFDWLRDANLDEVPADHPAVKQALTDLLTTLERHTDVEYGTGGSGLTQEEIDAARADVAKHMDW